MRRPCVRARRGELDTARRLPMIGRYTGRWSIARSIVDASLTAGAIACTGTATLRRHATTIVYDETVSFRLANKPIRATRTYIFEDAAGEIVARFADGAPFFRLRLNAGGTGTAVHLCGADRYTLWLTLREPESWETRWDCSGGKAMRIITRYTR